MPITSGVRAIRGGIIVDGVSIPTLSLTVTLPTERKSSTWSASCAIGSLPAARNEAYWASQNPKEVECFVSINDVSETLLVGVVDSFDAPLAETTISFRGRCLSAKLHEKKSREKFRNKKPEEIITDLASRAGLSADIDSAGLKAGKFVQIDWDYLTAGHSFSEIINHFCELMGARWWVEKKTLHVKKDAQSGVYIVNYVRGGGETPEHSDGLRVTVTRNMQSARPAKVTTQGWNTTQKKVVKASSTVNGVGDTVEYSYDVHNVSPEHASAHAKGKAKEHARHEFSIHVEMVGDTSVVRASKLGLRGNAYAGDYDLDTITHTVAGSFKTSLSAKSAKAGRTAT